MRNICKTKTIFGLSQNWDRREGFRRFEAFLGYRKYSSSQWLQGIIFVRTDNGCIRKLFCGAVLFNRHFSSRLGSNTSNWPEQYFFAFKYFQIIHNAQRALNLWKSIEWLNAIECKQKRRNSHISIFIIFLFFRKLAKLQNWAISSFIN